MHLRIKDVRFPGRVMSVGSGHKFRRTVVKATHRLRSQMSVTSPIVLNRFCF